MNHVSIILPVLNESAGLAQCLAALPAETEIIVVDGGSTDDTADIAQRAGARLMTSSKGRALQMNAGALGARGDVLVFLHADTSLPIDFAGQMQSFLASESAWGRFDISLSGRHCAFRLIEFMMNGRSRLTGICTGDQAIFVRRSVFHQIGGYPAIALMEDIALSRRLKRIGRPWCCHSRVVSSSRRWERRGIARTVLMMWRLRLAYFLGAASERLAQRYDG